MTCVFSAIRRMPRGGFPLLRMISRSLPALQAHPIKLRLVPGAAVEADLRESVFFPLWKHGCYPHQLGEDVAALALLRRGDVVWDIGANIGYTALVFAHAVGENGHVLAVEPSRRSFDYLQRTVARWPQIRTLNAAVSDRDGWVSFEDRKMLDLSLVTGETGPAGYQVSAVTLDSLLELACAPPAFVKIDTEGHEHQVISGGRQLISRHTPLVQFEALNTPTLRGTMAQLSEFSAGGYEFFRATQAGRLLPIDADPTTDATNNFYAVPAGGRTRIEALVASASSP